MKFLKRLDIRWFALVLMYQRKFIVIVMVGNRKWRM